MHVRFYAPDAGATGDLARLPADEAEHLTRVLRLRAGALVRVFNGRGAEFDAHVERAAKAAVVVRLGARREPAREPRIAVTLAQAVLTGDKMNDVVRDAVMMGVAAVQPMVCERSGTAATAISRAHRRERWERTAISSAKQCGRATVPEIRETRSMEDLVAGLAEGPVPRPGLMLVEPGAAPSAVAVYDVGALPAPHLTLFVGPEGGWTAAETEAASRVCQLVTIGGRTLRADAASVVALAALFAIWKAF